MLKIFILTIAFLCQIGCTSGSTIENDSADEYFTQKFDEMADIIASIAANKSFQLQKSDPLTMDDKESLSMDETMEMSNIFRSYLKEKMRIFVHQDIQNAASNIKGDYYTWDNMQRAWFNRSSGYTLFSAEAAENANIQRLMNELDQTVFDVLNSSPHILKKRQWYRTLTYTTKKVLKSTAKNIDLPKPKTKPIHGKTPDTAPLLKSKGPPISPPQPKLKWDNYFDEQIKHSKNLLQKSESPSFRKTQENLKQSWKLFDSHHPRQYLIAIIKVKVRTFMMSLGSISGITTEQSLLALKALNYLHNLAILGRF